MANASFRDDEDVLNDSIYMDVISIIITNMIGISISLSIPLTTDINVREKRSENQKLLKQKQNTNSRQQISRFTSCKNE